MSDSIQYTGTNKDEIEAFTGGKIKSDAMDGTVLISGDKQRRVKVTPGDYISKTAEGNCFLTTYPLVD